MTEYHERRSERIWSAPGKLAGVGKVQPFWFRFAQTEERPTPAFGASCEADKRGAILRIMADSEALVRQALEGSSLAHTGRQFEALLEVSEAIARLQKNYSQRVTGTLTVPVRRVLHLP